MNVYRLYIRASITLARTLDTLLFFLRENISLVSLSLSFSLSLTEREITRYRKRFFKQKGEVYAEIKQIFFPSPSSKKVNT